MSILPTSNNGRRALYRGLSIGGIAILGVLAFVSRAFGADVHVLATVTLLPILALAGLQFGALDEMARRAHFAAWYWGCFLALIAIGVVAVGVSTGAALFAPIAAQAARLVGETPASAFVAGLMAGPVLMLAGYLVWSAIYWLRTR